MTEPALAPEPDQVPDNVRHLRPAAKRWAEWPITLVLVIIAISLGIVTGDHFRRGSVLLAAGVVLAFFLRLLLPDREAGMLAVRSKRIDLAVLGGLALAVSVLALAVPPPS